MPKEGPHCNCLSVVLINSVFKMGKNFTLKYFQENTKKIVKEKEMNKYINEDLEISSDSDESGQE